MPCFSGNSCRRGRMPPSVRWGAFRGGAIAVACSQGNGACPGEPQKGPPAFSQPGMGSASITSFSQLGTQKLSPHKGDSGAETSPETQAGSSKGASSPGSNRSRMRTPASPWNRWCWTGRVFILVKNKSPSAEILQMLKLFGPLTLGLVPPPSPSSAGAALPF